VLHIPVVDETVNLLNSLVDRRLFSHLGGIPVIAAILDHVLNSSFSTEEVGLQVDHILILLDALLLEISFVNIQVQHNSEECLESSLRTFDAVQGIEVHWCD